MNAGPIPHGPSPSTSNFSWTPSVIERDGTYYLYFGANDMHEKGIPTRARQTARARILPDFTKQ